MKTVDIDACRRRLLKLVGELWELFRVFGQAAYPESPAEAEARLLADPEVPLTVASQTSLLFESINDHVVAATRILAVPVQPIAPFSLVRSALEVSSICCWILDPTLTGRERMSRSLAFHQTILRGQKTMIAGNPELDDGGLATRLAFVDDKEKRWGTQRTGMPRATDLVAAWFGKPAHYRLASAVVHGHPWAVAHVAFTRGTSEATSKGTVLLTPTLKPDLILYLLVLALKAVVQPAWMRAIYFGYDRERLARTLETAYDDIQMVPSERFWRDGAQHQWA